MDKVPKIFSVLVCPATIDSLRNTLATLHKILRPKGNANPGKIIVDIHKRKWKDRI